MSTTSCWDDFLYLLRFIGNFIKGMAISTYYIIKAILLFFVPKCLLAKDVSKDIVLITGGASGLGRLFALKFAKRGATVVIWDLNLAGLEETTKMVEELRSKKEKAGKCYHYVVDISRRENVYAAAERVKQEIGDVTIIVNNAGVVNGRRFMELQDEKIIKTFEVNALAHFWIIKAFLPAMMENNRGHLVSVASIAGLIGAYQLTDYCASKFAAVGLEESLRLELNCDGYDGIHSTVICPYYIKTGMFAGIRRSLIPIMTPEFVVNEAMKAILVNQEMLCVPWVVYFMLIYKWMVPAKSFMWGHRAIGAASTMKTFYGREGAPPGHQTVINMAQKDRSLLNPDKAGPDAPKQIGITIPEQLKPTLQLQQ